MQKLGHDVTELLASSPPVDYGDAATSVDGISVPTSMRFSSSELLFPQRSLHLLKCSSPLPEKSKEALSSKHEVHINQLVTSGRSGCMPLMISLCYFYGGLLNGVNEACSVSCMDSSMYSHICCWPSLILIWSSFGLPLCLIVWSCKPSLTGYCDSKTTAELMDLAVADINGRDRRGYRVLHVETMRRDPEIIGSVLEEAANPLDLTADGLTPLQISKRSTRNSELNGRMETREDYLRNKICIEILEQAYKENTQSVFPVVGEGEFYAATIS